MLGTGNIAAWKVKIGDEVAAGDSLAEVETDKATMAWESQVRMQSGAALTFCARARLCQPLMVLADSLSWSMYMGDLGQHSNL